VVGYRPQEAVDCVVNVVSEECGQEIAGKVRELGSKVLAEMGCAKRKRQ